MWEFLQMVLDKGRSVCYLAAAAASRARPIAGQLLELLGVVAKWRLWRAGRKRPRVLRQWWRGIRFDFRFDVRRGWVWIAWTRLGNRGGIRAADPPTEVEMPKKPASAGANGGPAPVAAKRCKFLSATPTLASYMTDTEYEEGGGHREPSYLIVRPGAGIWAATLKDPTEGRQVRVAVDTLSAVFPALEALLVSDVCPWEPDPWAKPAGSKKKK